MSDYNTGNLVPSTDPRDLDDNATNFDRLLMQSVPSVPDRLGVPRKTWWQMEQDASALVSPNVSALAAAVSAANTLFYFTGSGTGTVTDFTGAARTFCAAANPSAQRNVIGAAVAGSNSDITQLSGLTTPLSPAQGGTGATSTGAGAVGAVSQSAGIPTGKIIEQGSNANGSYTKWADGGMECTKYITSEAVAVTTANGNVFTGLAATWTFPVPFVGALPVLTGHVHDTTGAVVWLGLRGGVGIQTLTSGQFRLVSGLSVSITAVLAYRAVGRWF